MLWVTFLPFGNSNNILAGCWASRSSPLPGRSSEVNNQNTSRNQGVVLDELNKVFFIGLSSFSSKCVPLMTKW